MKGDPHVRFCERLGVQFPWATHAVLCFQHRDDAEKVLQVLPKRFARFGLTLHPEKTRLVDFGRQALESADRMGTKPGTFDFLGYVSSALMFCPMLKRPPAVGTPLLSTT